MKEKKRNKLVKKQPFKGKTAVVSGASEGIGKAIAKFFVELGASVCIIARRTDVLEEAKKEIQSLISEDSQFVEAIACDATDMAKLKPLLEGFVKKHGVPDYLINVVGFAMPDYVENHTLADYKAHMDINYYGQLVPTLIMIPHFMKQKSGHIVFVSSVAGFIGLIGYTAYTPTKAALIGLAESLKNELSPYKINISLIFPPDVDTPQFKRENEVKPKECAIMSERAGLLQPEEIAEDLIEGIMKNKVYITPGDAGFYWWAKRHVTGIVLNITNKDLKKARKKMGKDYKY